MTSLNRINMLRLARGMLLSRPMLLYSKSDAYRRATSSRGYKMLVRVRARIYQEHGLCPAWALIDNLLTRMRSR